MQNHPAEDVRAAAERYARWFSAIAEAIADQFEEALRAGVSGEGVLDGARDVLIENGLYPVQAANIVRLAAHSLAKRFDLVGYTDADLREICSRIATAR